MQVIGLFIEQPDREWEVFSFRGGVLVGYQPITEFHISLDGESDHLIHGVKVMGSEVRFATSLRLIPTIGGRIRNSLRNTRRSISQVGATYKKNRRYGTYSRYWFVMERELDNLGGYSSGEDYRKVGRYLEVLEAHLKNRIQDFDDKAFTAGFPEVRPDFVEVKAGEKESEVSV